MRTMCLFCGTIVAAVMALALVGSGVGLATDCSGCAPRGCGWELEPQSTTAEDKWFDADLTIAWCFADGNPIAGIVQVGDGCQNIGSITYTPSSFQTYDCVGDQVVNAHGELSVSGDGTLKSKASIGAYPSCNAVHTLAIDG